jgi:hypothetical protein
VEARLSDLDFASEGKAMAMEEAETLGRCGLPHLGIDRRRGGRERLGLFSNRTMPNAATHYDVAIIGAGLSALAAGVRLAHFGKKVCLFERHNVVGGLNSFYGAGGRKYDVGLHAMTNFVPREVRGTALGKLLRQLRIERDALDLCPQLGSAVRFPGRELRFTNDPAVLEAEVARAFSRAGRRLPALRGRDPRLRRFRDRITRVHRPRDAASAYLRTGAGGHAAVSAVLLWQRDAARHGRPPVRDHVQGRLPRGLRPAIRGHPRGDAAVDRAPARRTAASAG